MDQISEKGQILIELISAVTLFIIFMSVSLLFYQDYEKNSYRYLMTEIIKEK